MAYVDDWYATPPDEQRELKQLCGFVTCGHMRYLHGSTSETRFMGFRSIEHKPGRCEICRCQVFQDHPITTDEIIDAAEFLGDETKLVHLSDLGITTPECHAFIARTTAEGAVVLPCRLTGGHEGDHST